MPSGFNLNAMKRILLLAAVLCLASRAGVQAQDYEPVPVKVSTEKVRLDGKVLYFHPVQERQTLYGIAKAYNVTIEEIYSVNPSLETTGLQKNSIILIPVIDGRSEPVDPNMAMRFMKNLFSLALSWATGDFPKMPPQETMNEKGRLPYLPEFPLLARLERHGQATEAEQQQRGGDRCGHERVAAVEQAAVARHDGARILEADRALHAALA